MIDNCQSPNPNANWRLELWKCWKWETSFCHVLTEVTISVAAQIQEMEMVRQKVYSLEQAQIGIKQR